MTAVWTAYKLAARRASVAADQMVVSTVEKLVAKKGLVLVDSWVEWMGDLMVGQ